MRDSECDEMDLRSYRKALPRVHVSIDILILILVSVSLFDFTPFAPVFSGNGTYTFYMLAVAVIYIRNLGFQIRYGIFPKLKPMWWILAGILISFIPAYLYYGQHLYHSIVVYRQFAGYLVYPVLLSIRPTDTEIKRALYIFSFIYFIALLWGTFIHPDWVVVSEGSDFMDSGDLTHRLPGDQFLAPALIYALNDFRNRKNKVKWALLSLFIFLVIFLIQSRTMLLAAVAVIVFVVLFEKKASRRLAAEVIIGLFFAMFILAAFTYVSSLFEETVGNLTNPEYNRVKAFGYFVSGVNGWPSYLWGNGFVSGHVHPIVEQLQMEGIYHSDLGLIGFWHQFGVIPTLTVLVYVIRGLFRNHSYVVRANALFILVSAMTIAYFLNVRYSLWLCLYFYLFYSDAEFYAAKKQKERLRERQHIRRYHSIVR